MIANSRQTIWSRLRSRFGYHAAEASTRRADSGTKVRSADDLLTEKGRGRVTATARDGRRNFAVAAWMVRKHLDYITSFTFQPSTGNADFDKAWHDRMVKWAGSKNACDVSGRRDLPTMLRMSEAHRVIDGDVLLVRLANGQLQPVEGDRIRTRKAEKRGDVPDNVAHGVVYDKTLRHLRYMVHKRTGRGTYDFERDVNAANAYLLGYFDEFDQLRGVSPLTTALNPLKDVYEAGEYALAKMKIAQLFGLAIYREALDEDDDIPGPDVPDDDTESDGADASAAEEDGDRYEVDFGKGPLKLELEPGDKAEFLESQSPSIPFQEFSLTEIGIALKSLDIPLCFYQEDKTNFYGSRAAAMQYERSCEPKRRDIQALLRVLTIWKTIEWVNGGELTLPAGLLLSDAIDMSEWVPQGTPWWKPNEEITGDKSAIRCGFKTHDQVTRQRLGKPFRQVVDAIAEEIQYARDRGVLLDTIVEPPQQKQESSP